MHHHIESSVAAVTTEPGEGGDTMVKIDLWQCWTISALQNVCFENRGERRSIGYSLTTTFALVLGVSG